MKWVWSVSLDTTEGVSEDAAGAGQDSHPSRPHPHPGLEVRDCMRLTDTRNQVGQSKLDKQETVVLIWLALNQCHICTKLLWLNSGLSTQSESPVIVVSEFMHHRN